MRLNLTGQKFGRLTPVKQSGLTPKKSVIWECLCDCGNVTYVVSSKLKNGHTKSCGCLHRDTVKKNETTHGQSKTKLYRKWRELKSRCENPNYPGYKNYGGRGIKLCDKWQSFEGFMEDYPNIQGTGDSLDRIDVNGDYSLENCRFVSQKAQTINTRRSSRIAPLIPVYRILYSISQNKEYIARVLGISEGQSYTLFDLAFKHEKLNGYSTDKLLSMSKKEIEDLL